MPELPEVETVRQVLKRQIINKTITDVKINYAKIIDNVDSYTFKEKLINKTFVDVFRKGKFLIFKLNEGYLISHLRMEGKYWFSLKQIDKHSHIIFYFNDDDVLIYHDVRKFGKMYYFDENININEVYPLNMLGKEPFEIDNSSYLYDLCKNIKKPIKEVLLNQKIISGIGNIYADEICFFAKIHPLKLASNLSQEDYKNILDASVVILNKAIKAGGSTIKTYQSAHGVDGKFQNELMVYGRNNLKCFICNSQILKIKVAGRGTCYCPNCQK